MLCDNCDGKGRRYKIVASLHNIGGLVNQKEEKCEMCEGTGRIVKRTETWIEAYDYMRFINE